MRRLLAALTALSVAFAGLAVALAAPASAGQQSGPPDSAGWWGYCNADVSTSGPSFASGDGNVITFLMTCNYKASVMMPALGYASTAHMTDGSNMGFAVFSPSGSTSTFGAPSYTTGNTFWATAVASDDGVTAKFQVQRTTASQTGGTYNIDTNKGLCFAPTNAVAGSFTSGTSCIPNRSGSTNIPGYLVEHVAWHVGVSGTPTSYADRPADYYVPPSSDPGGYFGACNLNIASDSSTATVPVKYQLACSYALPASTPPGKQTLGFTNGHITSNGRLDLYWKNTSGVLSDHPIFFTNNGDFWTASVSVDDGSTLRMLQSIPSSCTNCATAMDTTQSSSAVLVYDPADNGSMGSDAYPLHLEHTTFVAYSASAAPAVPTDWTLGAGIAAVVPCSVTWDAPSTGGGVVTGPYLFTGTIVTFSIHLEDLSRYVGVDVGIRRTNDQFGDPTPAAPAPPAPDSNFVSASSTTLAHDMTLQVTAPADGTYQYSYRCRTTTGGLTNEIGGTLLGVDPFPSTDVSVCVPVPGVDTCGQRPSPADCLPSTSGGLFGVIGTVLDPSTYVHASICMAEALFEPGPSTIAAMRGLWADVQSHAPFSFIAGALTFLPDAMGGLQSGISSGGCPTITAGDGSAWTNPSGTTGASGACAMAGANGSTLTQLGVMRLVILVLFTVSTGIALVKSTLRILN